MIESGAFARSLGQAFCITTRLALALLRQLLLSLLICVNGRGQLLAGDIQEHHDCPKWRMHTSPVRENN